MKTLFYSIKKFERPYFDIANKTSLSLTFTTEALSLQTVYKANGFNAISVFTGDDVNGEVLLELHKMGVDYIVTRAAGYDNIDIEKANDLDMIVANVPKYSPYAIAEHAVALILALNRKLIKANTQFHKQNFTVDDLIGFDLNGKTVGVIGTGTIGSVFTKIMHGFGCKLFGYDIKQNKKLIEDYELTYVDLDTLLKCSDIISLHTGLNVSTKHLINKETLGKIKPHSMLINTGRGGCVDTRAVINSLQTGRLSYYGADVYENEKGIFFKDLSATELTDELLKELMAQPNVLLTPHQAFATREALENIATTTVYNLRCMANNTSCRNILTKSAAAMPL